MEAAAEAGKVPAIREVEEERVLLVEASGILMEEEESGILLGQ